VNHGQVFLNFKIQTHRRGERGKKEKARAGEVGVWIEALAHPYVYINISNLSIYI
jgi:hypothetical protein